MLNDSLLLTSFSFIPHIIFYLPSFFFVNMYMLVFHIVRYMYIIHNSSDIKFVYYDVTVHLTSHRLGYPLISLLTHFNEIAKKSG